jgi:hypothetical protein
MCSAPILGDGDAIQACPERRDVHEKKTITHELAARMVAAAIARAKELGARQTVAVLDEDGNLKAFGRMDGAPILGIESDAWSLHCPKVRDSKVRGESKYEVDVVLAWNRLSDHPAREALRDRLVQYADALSRVLGVAVTFSD